MPQPSVSLQEKIEEVDLDFLLQDLPNLLFSMKDGVDRIANISTSLRTFSRADIESQQPFNLHDGIDSTLLILRHRLKANEHRSEIAIIKNYGDPPLINSYPGSLNQVFMNLIANAIDALEEKIQTSTTKSIKTRECITITTSIDPAQNTVTVQIQDTGIGIPNDVKQRIFEHLYTTKPVGQGTGLGLAIARQIIVEKHDGTLQVNSELGQGAEFVIIIPTKTN